MLRTRLGIIWIRLEAFKRGVGGEEGGGLLGFSSRGIGIVGTRYGCYDGRKFQFKGTIHHFLDSTGVARLSLAIISPFEANKMKRFHSLLVKAISLREHCVGTVGARRVEI